MPKSRTSRQAILIGVLAAPALYLSESIRAQENTDNCLQLIALSRATSEVVQQQSDFFDTVRHFCNEYERSKTRDDSANYGGRLEALSFSMGRSASSEDNVASKYCSFEGGTIKSLASYRQYLNGISPGAYEAYQACLAAKDEGVIVSLARQPRMHRLDLVIYFNSDAPNSQATLSYTASAPVTCAWEYFKEDGDDSRAVIPNLQRTRLLCSRENPRTKPVTEPDFVHVIRVTGGATDLNFDWKKYNEAGEPFLTIAEIQEAFDRHTNHMQGKMDELEKRHLELTEKTESLSLASARPLDVFLGELPVKEDRKATYKLSRHVGEGASAVLLYAYLTTGNYNSSHPADFRFSVNTNAGVFSTFLRAQGYRQDAWSYNSDHFWMPVPEDGDLVVEWLGESMSGSLHSGVKLIAYR